MKRRIRNRKSGSVILILVLLIVSVGRVIPVFAAPPTNDDIAGATVVASLPYTDALNTSEATVEGTEPTYDCGWNVGKTVWYNYTPGSTGDVVVNTKGSNFSTVVHVFEASGMIPVDCNAEGWDGNVLFTATAGTTYLISIGGYNGLSGDLVFNMVEPGSFTTCASVDVPEAECDALEALYTATNGASWNDNSQWITTDLVCTWYGINCYGGEVVEIYLYSNNLVNDFSTVNLLDLPNLFRLNLGANDLAGDMSTVISNLPTNIVQLYLYSNEFTGTLPAEISSFTNLSSLKSWE